MGSFVGNGLAITRYSLHLGFSDFLLVALQWYTGTQEEVDTTEEQQLASNYRSR